MTTRLIEILEQPITLADAKLHLREDDTASDDLITALIGAASSLCAKRTGRAIAKSTYRLMLDKWPDDIRLLWPPVVSVESVKYIDPDGTTQTLASSLYALDLHSEPAWVIVADEWPEAGDFANAITVDYTAGYGAACPHQLRVWMLMHIGHWYRNREAVAPGGWSAMPMLDTMIDGYRRRMWQD